MTEPASLATTSHNQDGSSPGQVLHWLDGRPVTWPVGKIICVGRNYAAHAEELGNAVPSEPLLFMKPATALSALDTTCVLPAARGALHYETELALLIGARLPRLGVASDTSVASAEARPVEVEQAGIAGLALALDLTDRELQSRLKAEGHPWERAKAFDGACPITRVVPWQGQDLSNLHYRLYLDGALRQDGHTAMMLFKVPQLLQAIRRDFTLLPGDLVLTGTPAGVGELLPGMHLRLESDFGIQLECLVETRPAAH